MTDLLVGSTPQEGHMEIAALVIGIVALLLALIAVSAAGGVSVKIEALRKELNK